VSLELIYVRTLGCSLPLPLCFANMIYDRWLGVPMTSSSFSDVKVGMVLMANQRGS